MNHIDTQKALNDIQLERNKLQLEIEKDQVEKIKSNKVQSKLRHAQAEADLADANRNVEARQSSCNHRKGGKGMQGLQGHGSDAYYAIIRHQYPWGAIQILCSRCGKDWKPGDVGYVEMMNVPTDNEASSSCQFRIEPARPMPPKEPEPEPVVYE